MIFHFPLLHIIKSYPPGEGIPIQSDSMAKWYFECIDLK